MGVADNAYKGPEQWTGDDNEHNRKIYRNLALMNMEEIYLLYPLFYDRLNATIPHIRGSVLEVGCGNGNITRWLAIKDNISKIHAFDISQYAIDELKSYHYPGYEKISCECSSLSQFLPHHGEKFDTLVMCEIIEHITLEEEIMFIDKIRRFMNYKKGTKGKQIGAQFVVSTPIGFMPDPTHCRGFSTPDFYKHISTYYGKIRGVTYTECQQVAWGNLNPPERGR